MAAKAISTNASDETRLMATPISDAGATANERMPATRQSMESVLLAFRMVPARELKTMITRLAATASLIVHPPT